MSERDWEAIVRSNLPRLGLDPADEVEVVEELAQILRDAWESENGDRDEVAFERFLDLQAPGFEELAANLARHPRRRGLTPAAVESGSGASGWLTGLRSDFRLAMRRLRRDPGFALVAALTLALGIGLNVSVFSLVDALLLRPYPVERPDEVMRLYTVQPNGFFPTEPMSYPDIQDLRSLPELETVSAYAMSRVALEVDGQAELAVVEMASGTYFELLGVKPRLGRLLQADDDGAAGFQPVVVLSDRAWRMRFGGARDVVGKTVRVNGEIATIVGVAPPEFTGLFRSLGPELWMPLHWGLAIEAAPMQSSGSSSNGLPLVEQRGRRWLWTIARRDPGVSFSEAEAAVGARGLQIASEYPDSNEQVEFISMALHDVRLISAVDDGLEVGSAILLALVGLVLLIACANLANMLLARGIARRGELALRRSLGAGRGRLLRQLMVESLVLAVLGALLSVIVVAAFQALLGRFDFALFIPIELGLQIDHRVLAATAGLAFVTAVVFGLVPAFESLSGSSGILRDNQERSGGSRRGIRLQSSLVVVQVALSALLLVVAVLTARSARNAVNMDLGFEPDGVVVAQLDPELQGYNDEQATQFYSQLTEDLAGAPGVVSVSTASHVPLTMWINTWDIADRSRLEVPLDQWPRADTAFVGPGYFETMQIPLIHGRVLDERDREGAARTAVVSRVMADDLWPGEEALGQHFWTSPEGEPFEVVGVAADGSYRVLGEAPRWHIWLPIDQFGSSSRTAIVRFDRADLAATSLVRRAIRKQDPHLAVSALGPIGDLMAPVMSLPRLAAIFFGLFGILGLLMAAVGLYGVLAYSVGRRTHEIGVRLALGASYREIITMVLQRGVLLTAIGLAMGVGLGLVAARSLSAILYGVSPTDPVTIALVTGTLLASAALACLIPARRAASIAPSEALRHD